MKQWHILCRHTPFLDIRKVYAINRLQILGEVTCHTSALHRQPGVSIIEQAQHLEIPHLVRLKRRGVVPHTASLNTATKPALAAAYKPSAMCFTANTAGAMCHNNSWQRPQFTVFPTSCQTVGGRRFYSLLTWVSKSIHMGHIPSPTSSDSSPSSSPAGKCTARTTLSFESVRASLPSAW